MLKIVFGDIENSIYHPPTYFDNQYEDEWITDPLAVVMIKDIDRSEVMGMYPIERMASYLQAIVNVMEGVENSATGGDATVWQGR